jgi:hypothetical protein
MNAEDRWTGVFLVFLFLGATVFFAQQSSQDWNREPAQESREHARMEAQDPDTQASVADLARASENLESSLIKVVTYNYSDFDIGPYHRTGNTVLEFLPSIPIRLSENWKIDTITVGTVAYQPDVLQPSHGTFGFRDLNPVIHLSPVKPHAVSWGIGPTFILPTASDDVLGDKKFCIGPTAIATVQPGNWTIGAVVLNNWSVAGSSTRSSQNYMILQYFLDYNLRKGWFLASEPVLLANWRASRGNVWRVPVGGGVGRVIRLGSQPMTVGVQAFGYAKRPDFPPIQKWQLKFMVSLLFPRKAKE